MSNYTKFLISKVLWVTEIWGTIAILYFARRTIDPSSAFFLIAFYSLCIVILEYPTWLISDTYWHKTSALLWFSLATCWFVLLSFNLLIGWYMMGLALLAAWKALKSWSMTAVLKWIVTDFKSKHIQVSTSESISKFLMAVLSWYIFIYNPIYVVYVAWIFAAISGLLFYTIPYTPTSKKGNIYSTALTWFRNIIQSKDLISLLLLLSVSAGYRQNIKNFITSMWDFYPISILFMTRAVWWHSLFRAIWSYSVKYFSHKRAIIWVFIVMWWMILTWGNYITILIWFILLSSLFQNIETSIEIRAVNTVQPNVIATVLSTFKLWQRLSWSLMLFIAWYILKLYSYQTMLSTISVIILAWILFYIFTTHITRKA